MESIASRTTAFAFTGGLDTARTTSRSAAVGARETIAGVLAHGAFGSAAAGAGAGGGGAMARGVGADRTGQTHTQAPPAAMSTDAARAPIQPIRRERWVFSSRQ